MDRQAAIDQIKDACKNIAREMLRVNPAINQLGDSQTQGELYQASYELTKQLEIIKKKVLKLQSGDDSSVL